MNDPHVASLRYRLSTPEAVVFASAPPTSIATPEFTATLENGVAVFQLLKHFPSEEAARAEVDPFVKTWEIAAALELDLPPKAIAFVFERADVIDRQPSSFIAQVISVTGIDSGTAFGTATVQKEFPEYPKPPAPAGFVASPDVRTLWQRWEGYQEGREPLPSMAYFCLTVVEARVRGPRVRHSAAKGLRIDPAILSEIGKLTSVGGDPKTARKFDPQSNPLTGAQERWLEEAVKALIRRVGEVDARGGDASSLPLLRLSDLPPV